MSQGNQGNQQNPNQQRANGPLQSDWQAAFEAQNVKLEAQQRQLETLTAALTALAGRPAQNADEVKSERERLTKKFEDGLAKMERLQVEKERWLLDGAKKFVVQTPMQPRQVRVVGAPDTANAQVKFESYFGIRQIVDPNNVPTMKEFDGRVDALPDHIQGLTKQALSAAA